MKNKVAIITVHDFNGNFGSTIQACSLCEYIRSLGWNPELIDYVPWSKSIRTTLIQLLINLLKLPYRWLRNKRFSSYWKTRVSLSKRYSSYEELSADPPIAERYFVGSDQVWNEVYPCGRDQAFYLAFTDSSEKYAFSASLGQEFTPEQLCSLHKKLKNFKRISVREKLSAEQIKASGSSIPVEYTLDPVFLYDKDHYLQICKDCVYPQYKYLLLYAIYPSSDNEQLFRIARSYAAKHKLKIVALGGMTRKEKFDKHIFCAGPKDFLTLIAHADFVLTHSFHGVAFSILLNTKFGCLEPTVSSLRIKNILETAGIPERMICEEKAVDIFDTPIDFESVNSKIQFMREKSRNVLREMLTVNQ